MIPFKTKMLTTTVIPVAVAFGVGVAGMAITGVVIGAGPVQAACAPCNPCAAKNPCNPCAAKNPCNPCAAANPCLAVNPCNPCAAKNPCNPCAANPCLAANPCNPCAANPCNPCAARGVASGCVIPRLAKVAVRNPCNPCAARNPCNPCAAKNPCNPCAAANPCNPCAAGAGVDLTDREAAKAYDCVLGQMRASYAKSGNDVAANYADWRRYSRVAYPSATHGGRYVQNYANAKARGYGAFENAGRMPSGAQLAKDSFAVNGTGQISPGPLFVMEKMRAGFNAASGDWRYTMIMPNGSVFGVTNGKNSAGMQFCIECHAAVAEDQDHMMLLPEEYRVR